MTENNETIESKIKDMLDKEIRPALAMDGGDVSFVEFNNGILSVELQGACGCCPHSQMTLKMGIESRMREAIPEVKEVISV